MRTNSFIKAALSATFLATAAMASPALALDAKQCMSMTDMNAALRAEGQRTMIIGDRLTNHDDTNSATGVRFNSFVNTVTSNADGSLGYQLEGDLPRAQTSNQVCVRAKLTDIQLYDARKPGVSQSAFLGGQFDRTVRDNEARGTRPMVVANTLHIGADGKEQRGLPVVVFGNMTGRSGSLVTRMPDGTPQMLALMGDVDYTPAALARFNPQVAMISPK